METIASILISNILWQSVIVALALYAALSIIPRSDPKTRYRLSMTGFFGTLLLLPAPFLPEISSIGITSSSDQLTAGKTGVFSPGLHLETYNASGVTISKMPFDLFTMLFWLWFTGSVIALIKLGRSFQVTANLRRQSNVLFLEPNRKTLSGNIAIRTSKKITCPIALGFFHPIILLPEALITTLSKRQLNAVLEHEYAHIKRGDLWVNLLQRLSLALLWWCLPLYWINRQVSREREKICDSIAAARTGSHGDLAHALVTLAESSVQSRTPILAIGLNSNFSGKAALIAERVQHLYKETSMTKATKYLTTGTMAAFSIAMLTLTAFAPRALATPPKAVHSNSQPGAFALSAAQALPAIKVSNNIVAGRITSKFDTIRPNINKQRHKGLDIGAPMGTDIYAPASGIVVAVSDNYWNQPKYGQVVVIKTKGNTRTMFAHLSSSLVRDGQTVEAGQAIAKVGSSGQSTGPHVHIETRQNGTLMDPLIVWPALGNRP